MFEIQSMNCFGEEDSNIKYVVVFMNRNYHAAKFEVLCERNNHGGFHFYYEMASCLTNEEKSAFEDWYTQMHAAMQR